MAWVVVWSTGKKGFKGRRTIKRRQGEWEGKKIELRDDGSKRVGEGSVIRRGTNH